MRRDSKTQVQFPKQSTSLNYCMFSIGLFEHNEAGASFLKQAAQVMLLQHKEDFTASVINHAHFVLRHEWFCYVCNIILKRSFKFSLGLNVVSCQGRMVMKAPASSLLLWDKCLSKTNWELQRVSDERCKMVGVGLQVKKTRMCLPLMTEIGQ